MNDFSKSKPTEIEAYLREVLRENFGTEIEEGSLIHMSHGFYTVSIAFESGCIEFSAFRKKDVGQIVEGLKKLRGFESER